MGKENRDRLKGPPPPKKEIPLRSILSQVKRFAIWLALSITTFFYFYLKFCHSVEKNKIHFLDIRADSFDVCNVPKRSPAHFYRKSDYNELDQTSRKTVGKLHSFV